MAEVIPQSMRKDISLSFIFVLVIEYDQNTDKFIKVQYVSTEC